MFLFPFNSNASLLLHTFVILCHFTIHMLRFPFIALTCTYSVTSNVSSSRSSCIHLQVNLTVSLAACQCTHMMQGVIGHFSCEYVHESWKGEGSRFSYQMWKNRAVHNSPHGLDQSGPQSGPL